MSWRAPVILAFFVVIAVLALRGTLISSGGYRLTADFTDADGLRPNFFVKVDGVVVGRVRSVTVDRRDDAVVTMQINSSALPIGTGATATIKPNSFFGERFVDIDRGNAAKPLPSGSTIPLSRTAEATTLDQLLDTLDDPTRVALASFLNESGSALVGRGHDIATALTLLPSTLQGTQQLLSNLADENRSLGDLLDRSSAIVTAIARQHGSLGRFVDVADGAFVTIASRDRQLGQTIRDSPLALSRLDANLGALRVSSAALIPAAHGLESTAAPLQAALRAIPAFTSAATPTLRTARTVAPATNRLSTGAAPVIAGLRAPTSQLETFADELAPAADDLSDTIENALGAVEGYARALQGTDAAGHIYRTNLVVADIHGLTSVFQSLDRRDSSPRSGDRTLLKLGGITVQLPLKSTSSAPGGSTAEPTPAGSSSSHSGIGSLLSGLLGGGGSSKTTTTTTTPTQTSGSISPIQRLLGYLLGR